MSQFLDSLVDLSERESIIQSLPSDDLVEVGTENIAGYSEESSCFMLLHDQQHIKSDLNMNSLLNRGKNVVKAPSFESLDSTKLANEPELSDNIVPISRDLSKIRNNAVKAESEKRGGELNTSLIEKGDEDNDSDSVGASQNLDLEVMLQADIASKSAQILNLQKSMAILVNENISLLSKLESHSLLTVRRNLSTLSTLKENEKLEIENSLMSENSELSNKLSSLFEEIEAMKKACHEVSLKDLEDHLVAEEEALKLRIEELTKLTTSQQEELERLEEEMSVLIAKGESHKEELNALLRCYDEEKEELVKQMDQRAAVGKLVRIQVDEGQRENLEKAALSLEAEAQSNLLQSRTLRSELSFRRLAEEEAVAMKSKLESLTQEVKELSATVQAMVLNHHNNVATPAVKLSSNAPPTSEDPGTPSTANTANVTARRRAPCLSSEDATAPESSRNRHSAKATASVTDSKKPSPRRSFTEESPTACP